MAKLVIIVDVVDAEPTHTDPHEAAADILYHYEAHREVNQDDPEVRFVQASWQTAVDEVLRFFEEVPDDVRPENYDDDPEGLEASTGETYEHGGW